MQCPGCRHQETRVLDSRVSSDGLTVRRRRECITCAFRFSTVEEIEILGLTLIKRNGHKEPYSRDKLQAGLKRALYKRFHSDEDIAGLVHTIERDIQLKHQQELPTAVIGDLVMRHLKKFDKVAYIRFASVYRQFSDLETFKEEVDALMTKNKTQKTKN
ncbi:MAG TPA: transcriptional regulator NrdR [Patescibacteria group bacterium]|nr:transcriptional regulator NrdR [Patescibacteria group bacterium]